MKAPALFGVVAAIHLVAFGLFSLVQGCAHRRPGEGMGGVPPANEGVAKTPAPSVGGELPPALPGGMTDTTFPPKRTTTPAADRPTVVYTPGPTTTPVKPVKPSTPVKPVTTPGTKKPLPTEGTPYQIKSGEALSKIAAAHGVSTLELASYNGISNPSSIRAGQKIMIPPGSGKKPTTPVSTLGGTPAATPAAKPLAADEYKVVAGDILGRIAVRFGVKVADLKKANNLASDSIRVGQVLKIPGKTASTPTEATPPVVTPAPDANSPVTPTPPTTLTPVQPARPVDPVVNPAVVTAPGAGSSDLAKPFEYTVGESETLDDIARMFVISADAIRRLNNLGPTDTLKAGQRIKIPPTQY